jgi:hypothetical protein
MHLFAPPGRMRPGLRELLSAPRVTKAGQGRLKHVDVRESYHQGRNKYSQGAKSGIYKI